jgi:hypothetical protein
MRGARVTGNGHAIDADVARIAAVVRQRLTSGAGVDELLRAVRPPSPHPDARLRDDGPIGASWRQPQTPLIGLAHLEWESAPPDTTRHVLDALSLPEPLSVRIARTDVFGSYRLIHAIFGKNEADYDLLMSADVQQLGEKPIVFNWTGSPIAEVLTKSHGDLSAYPEQYLRVFCALTGSDSGRFAIVDATDGNDDERAESLPIAAESSRRAVRDILVRRRSAPQLLAVGADGALRYRACILYQQALFMSELELSHNGRVEMTSDQVLWTAA